MTCIFCNEWFEAEDHWCPRCHLKNGYMQQAFANEKDAANVG